MRLAIFHQELGDLQKDGDFNWSCNPGVNRWITESKEEALTMRDKVLLEHGGNVLIVDTEHSDAIAFYAKRGEWCDRSVEQLQEQE